MKNNAIVRIVLYSLAILMLLGLLGLGLGIRMFTADDTPLEITHTTPKNNTTLPTGDADQSLENNIRTADPAKVANIEIEWAAGSIRIEPSADVSDIQVKESEVEDKYRMVCKHSGSTLTIRFCKDSIKFPSFGVDNIAKDLVIVVPADWVCKELDIDAAAADVTIKNMSISKVDFDGASGICHLDNCHVGELDVDAASGELNFSGVLDRLEFDGASADCTLVLSECPRHIDLEGMSGKLYITLPSDCGFTVNTDGLNCDFTTDFKTTSHNGAHRHGDGSCLIEISALSGCVEIHDSGSTCHNTESHGNQGHHSGHH